MRSFYLMDRDIDFYPGGGYLLRFSNSLDEDIRKLRYIRVNQWLDYRTRLLVFDMTLYSPAYQSFVDVHLCISQSRMGAFQYFSSVSTLPSFSGRGCLAYTLVDNQGFNHGATHGNVRCLR